MLTAATLTCWGTLIATLARQRHLSWNQSLACHLVHRHMLLNMPASRLLSVEIMQTIGIPNNFSAVSRVVLTCQAPRTCDRIKIMETRTQLESAQSACVGGGRQCLLVWGHTWCLQLEGACSHILSTEKRKLYSSVPFSLLSYLL